MTAMTAATLDTLSGGRFRLGLGVSGPQVSEGWHGVRFDKPLARTREYVEIVRTGAAPRDGAYEGEHFTLPLPDGPGKALKLDRAPGRATTIPVYLAAVGPKNLELAGEIADGWLAIFFAPEHAGRAARATSRPAGPRPARTSTGFDVVPTVPVVVGDDVAGRAPTRSAAYAALYIGGMGSREKNFYNQLAVRMGYERGRGEVQDLYLARQHRDADGGRAVRVHRPDVAARAAGADPERLHGVRRGRGDHAVASRRSRRRWSERIATLRTVAEALDASGPGVAP